MHDTDIVQALFNIQASRYVAAAGLVMLLYDHFLTFSEEVELVWKAESTVAKGMFLFLRYLVPSALIVNAYQFSGLGNPHMSSTFCKTWVLLGASIGLVTLAVSNFLVLLRIWNVWGRDHSFMLLTLLLFLITNAGTIACAVIAFIRTNPHIYYHPTMRICAIEDNIGPAIIWVPGLVFEVVVFTTMLYHSCVRQPRQGESAIARILYQNGFAFFVCLLTLRMINVLISAIAPMSLLCLAVYFIWSSTTLIVTRLILNLRRVTRDESIHSQHSDGANSGLEFGEGVHPFSTTISPNLDYYRRSRRDSGPDSISSRKDPDIEVS